MTKIKINLWKWLTWLLGIVILIMILTGFIFYRAGSPKRSNQKQIQQLAFQKTPITQIKAYYHLSRDKVVSNAVLGVSRSHKKYYFIFIPSKKKAYLYPSKKGYSESQVKKLFSSDHQSYANEQLNLGWYHNKPVWEISYRKPNGRYGYALYDYKTGEEISYIDNL